MSKQLRKNGAKARRARSAAYVADDMHHWHRRILGEMKQSQRVINLVTEGKADAWLEKPKAAAK